MILQLFDGLGALHLRCLVPTLTADVVCTPPVHIRSRVSRIRDTSRLHHTWLPKSVRFMNPRSWRADRCGGREPPRRRPGRDAHPLGVHLALTVAHAALMKGPDATSRGCKYSPLDDDSRPERSTYPKEGPEDRPAETAGPRD